MTVSEAVEACRIDWKRKTVKYGINFNIWVRPRLLLRT